MPLDANILIHLDRLEATQEAAALREAALADPAKFPQFAASARASELVTEPGKPFRFAFVADQVGCAAIAISIWGSAKDASVPAGSAGGEHRWTIWLSVFRSWRLDSRHPNVLADKIAQPFTSGFASLLATELGEPAAEARPVVAALHVFEVPLQRGQAAALAVFVAGGDAAHRRRCGTGGCPTF